MQKTIKNITVLGATMLCFACSNYGTGTALVDNRVDEYLAKKPAAHYPVEPLTTVSHTNYVDNSTNPAVADWEKNAYYY